MSRFRACFERLAEEKRRALIPYVVAGDPEPGLTLELLHALVGAGADALELGVPFSDPMSEGPVIQRAHERALAHGMRLRGAIEVAAAFRREDPDTPLLLMGYANPVERMGYAAFADAASAAGVDALLTVDIPPEEVASVNAELQRVGMDNIFLVSPTTPPARTRIIVEQASGFIYYVALKGVTGAAHLDSADVPAHIDEIRHCTRLPVCVGFGIKDAESARAVGRCADGVVVGSSLVQAIHDAWEAGGVAGALSCARDRVGDIRRGLDSLVA